MFGIRDVVGAAGRAGAGWTRFDRTGADGWADFPALSFGDATVLVQAPGFARHRIGWRERQKELRAELAPEAVLAGEVRDAAGAPLKAFYVSLSRSSDQILASIRPDDKGRFRITELPAGEWTVVVRSGDGRSVLHEQAVTLKAGRTKELKIKAGAR